MPLVSYFRALLLLYTVLIFGELASMPLTLDTLPEGVRKFAEDQWNNGVPEDEEGAIAIVSLTALGLMTLSLAGLFVLWRPARLIYTMYLLSIAIGVVLSGVVVESSLTSVLSFMNTIISGLILGMIYFSPLREHFDKPSPGTGRE
ncbi:MAG TPA: hypothetical protein VK633_09250 [Verrucomicrobiae bacterium]|nr:hypothetical protein [Verrucomicrobiae bacterium]